MTTYLLDANVFIQAKNLHYGFEFCPAFWEWIDRANAAGAVFSIERVGDEIRAGDDELAEWARDRPELVLAPDETMVPSLSIVSSWASGAGYEPLGPATFFRSPTTTSSLMLTPMVMSSSPTKLPAGPPRRSRSRMPAWVSA